MNPLVTVNILSYNRKEELRNTITKVYEQDYKNIEVIVVDNASTDGSPEMVEKEFPDAILIKLDKNIGIAGWNKGFEIARGEYVLVLDDDAYPDYRSISFAVLEFADDNSIACIAFNIIDLNKNNKLRTIWLPDSTINRTNWVVFVGCASMFRRKVIPVNVMPEDYFIYHHELPVASNLINSGYTIRFRSDISAFHFFKDQNEYSIEKDIFEFQNVLKYLLTYLPNYLRIVYTFQLGAFFLLRAIRKNWVTQFFQTLINFNFTVERTPISKEYLYQLKKYKIINYSILSKFKKK